MIHNHSLKKRLLWKKGENLFSLNVSCPSAHPAAGVWILCLLNSLSGSLLLTQDYLVYNKFHWSWESSFYNFMRNAQFIYLRRQRMKNWNVLCQRSSSRVECPFLSKSYKICLISLMQISRGPNSSSQLCVFKDELCHLQQASPIIVFSCGPEDWRSGKKM